MEIDAIKMSGTLPTPRRSRSRARRRIDRRLRPTFDRGLECIVQLEPRLLLSARAESGHSAAHIAARIKRATELEAKHAEAAHSHGRITPAQEINATYAASHGRVYATQLNNYIQAIDENSSNVITVSATVTSAVSPLSTLIPVDNAAVFGPAGMFSSPVTATASFGDSQFRHGESLRQLGKSADRQ